MTFTSGGVTFAGTLATPAGTGPFAAALVVPGSGPVDRDSNHKRMPLGITRELAEALTAAGVATLRYDKRGVGATPGDWREAGFDTTTDDVRTALAALRARPEVDASRVVVVGHSEGALHATRVAADDGDLAGVVLLSGSATPGEELLRWQARQVAATLPRAVRVLLAVLRTDLVEKSEKNRQQIKASTGAVVRVGGQKLNAAWHREFMAYDPRVDLARIAVPVLAVTGGKDLQTKASDLAVIESLVRGPVEVEEVPDVSHVLRRQPGPASLSAYKKEIRESLDERVVGRVVAWVTRQVRTTTADA
ncbi:alpha/beta hydrolase [Cellulomonas sp. APG4]|nr:alpha/beta fold hydrolase [Cellulomonas sp. APG4]NCT90483.1 alpha/beta hydrolase [Cellulomonas sp. APG4]